MQAVKNAPDAVSAGGNAASWSARPVPQPGLPQADQEVGNLREGSMARAASIVMAVLEMVGNEMVAMDALSISSVSSNSLPTLIMMIARRLFRWDHPSQRKVFSNSRRKDTDSSASKRRAGISCRLTSLFTAT